MKRENIPAGAWDDGAMEGGGAIGTGGTAAVNARTLGVAGFEEAVLRFNDAVERLVRNEKEVASTGGALDLADQQAAVWNGEVNSRLSAAQRLLGDLDLTATTGELPVATAPLDAAVRHAVTLLRASGVDVFTTLLPGGDLPTGTKYASWVVTALRADHGQSTSDDDIQRFLVNNGLLPADFASAAQYLRQESDVLRRPRAPVTDTAEGVPRSFGYSSPPTNPMPAERRAEHGASFTRAADDWSLDESYAAKGAAQTMQYFKNAGSLAIDQSLGDDVTVMAQRIQQTASALAGEMSVRFRWTSCTDAVCTLGVMAIDLPARGQRPPRVWLAFCVALTV